GVLDARRGWQCAPTYRTRAVTQIAAHACFFAALRCFKWALHAFTASWRVGPSVLRGKRDAGRLPQRFDDRADEAGMLQHRLDEAHRRFYLIRSLCPTDWKFYSRR